MIENSKVLDIIMKIKNEYKVDSFDNVPKTLEAKKIIYTLERVEKGVMNA